MNSPKVQVVILNYNGVDLLRQYLPSVIKNSPEAEVIVADNASTDSSVSFMKDNYPQVKLIQNEVNLGYAGGYNNALEKLNGEFFVLLNNDVEVCEGWLSPLIESLSANDKVAAVQPKLLDYSNRNKFEYAGACGGYLDLHGYPFCRGRIFDTLEDDNFQYDSVVKVFWATGACIAIKSKAFKEVGGFDASLFAHMEEIDLCWRLQNMGYYIYCNPNSIVYHLGGGTLKKASTRKTFLNFRNSLIVLLKNHPSRLIFFRVLWRLHLDGLAGAKFLFAGDFGSIVAIIKAHFSFYGRLPKTISERKRLTNMRKEKVFPTYKKSIVLDYYVRGKKKFSDLNKADWL